MSDDLVEIFRNFCDAYPESVFPTPPEHLRAKDAAAADVMRTMALPWFKKAADEIERLDGEINRIEVQRLRLQAEIERLRKWKAEATEVLTNWDLVAGMVTPRPQDLGRRKADLVADKIEEQAAEIERLRVSVEVMSAHGPRTCPDHWPDGCARAMVLKAQLERARWDPGPYDLHSEEATDE